MNSFRNMPQPLVLLFCFRPEERSMRIIRYLEGRGVSVKMVQRAEYGEKLGALCSLPGYEKRGVHSFLPELREELLVMHGFDQTLLDDFLRFFRTEGLRRVELKAVLTPTNADWTAPELPSHLDAERKALQKRAGS